MDGLSFLLCQGQRPGEEFLFLQTEELLWFQFVFARFGTSEESHVQHHHVLLTGIDAVEYRAQVIKGVVVADHHQDIAGAHSERPPG